MATESFEQDMILDTEEAIQNLIDLLDSGVKWQRGGTRRLELVSADNPDFRDLVKKYLGEDIEAGEDDADRVLRAGHDPGHRRGDSESDRPAGERYQMAEGRLEIRVRPRRRSGLQGVHGTVH